ncbi:MAG: GntR family transcriptional regulator [bacterium]
MKPRGRQEGIRQVLTAQICAGKWAVGEKLPGVRELAVEFAASPATVDLVLRSLVGLHYLVREERRGTFVAPAENWGASETNSTRLIGVIAGFAAYILPHIDQELRERGYGMVARHVHDDIEVALASVEELRAHGVRGFIWSPLSIPNHERDNTRLATAILRTGLPSVAVDQYPAAIEVNCITSDNSRAGYALTNHLLSLGHTRIGLIRFAHGSTPEDRYCGYARALREADVTEIPSLVLTMDIEMVPQQAVTIIREWLVKERPTAVWATTANWLGTALLAATQAAGLAIPVDLSVATFDEVVAPFPVTSVIQPFAEMGHRSVRLLAEEIEHPSGETHRIVLNSKIIFTASCARIT